MANAAPSGWAGPPAPDERAGRGGAAPTFFEAAFTHSPDVIVVVDARRGLILDANLATRRYLGWEATDLIGRHIDELWPPNAGDEDGETGLMQTVRTHGGGFGEREVRRVDGSRCCMLMRASLSRAGDRQVIILTLHDITARKRTEEALLQAERRYRGIFENAVEGMFQSTPDGRYLSANRALARIYGYESPQALIAALTDIAGQLYVDKHRRAEFQRLLREDDVVQGFESLVYRRDGSKLWISENARAVRDAGGRLLYYEGTVVDVSERKHLQEEEARAMRDLRHASRLKSEFVATMSHELRTPLNIILGYTELLADGAFGSLALEQIDVIDRVQRTGHELLELINATLDLSRLDAGAMPVDPQTVDLNAVLDELDGETQEVRQKPGVVFAWQIPPALPTIQSDPGKIKLVLKNLIVNAIKFTPAGRVTVSADAHPDGVLLAVADTGIGIPAEAMPIIFEPFRQVDGSETRHYGGVGLGLHIVKRVVNLLNGSIEVESTPGAGSTFRVRLPL